MLTEMNGEPFSRTPHLKKNKYLRGYKAQIGFSYTLHLKFETQCLQIRSDMVYAITRIHCAPSRHQHSEHHACSAVTRSSTRQSQIASSIGLRKNSSLYSGVTKTQTILAKIETHGRQVFALRGFRFGIKLGGLGETPCVTVWNRDRSRPSALRRIVYTGFCCRMKSAVHSGDRRSCVTAWRAGHAAQNASQAGCHQRQPLGQPPLYTHCCFSSFFYTTLFFKSFG